jgi:hypothetical protein
MTAHRIMRFPTAIIRDPAVDVWIDAQPGPLGEMARHWFDVMRACGKDVRELMHDDQPTACVGDAAFAYVDAFQNHVNVGFYLGVQLADPGGLLEGAGKFMRHVKLRPGVKVDVVAIEALINGAYTDMKARAT